MDSNFWRERWRRNELGFHRESTHPALKRHWETVSGSSSAGAVLVPLCGKTLDMHWLAEQGHPVVGVELDRSAIKAFFDEAGMTAAVDGAGPMPSWSAGMITLFLGDFLQFQTPKRFGLVYDRAALIALPAEMRPHYLDHLASLLKPDARGLLITLEYPQDRMQGPPFAVMPDELHSHPAFGFKCLQRSDVLASHEPFANQGLPWLREAVYAIRVS